MKSHTLYLQAGVMATVIVISTLLMILVLGVITVWNGELFLFGRVQFIGAQRDNIHSAFVLYETHPDYFEGSATKLYDSISSEITLKEENWGLYKIVTITAVESHLKQIRLMGQRNNLDYTLYYPAKNGLLNVSGNTNIEGKIRVPKGGISYSQMDSEFFSGKQLSSIQFAGSNDSIMPPIAKRQVERLFEYPGGEMIPHRPIITSFCDSTNIYVCNNNLLALCTVRGNVILLADQLYIDRSSELQDIIVVGNHLTVGSGFKGAIQLFARDSLIVEEQVELTYPSGLYSNNYIELNNDSSIDGYTIVIAPTKKRRNILYNYKQAVTAKVRGMLYVNGIAQLQGIVNGVAIINRANYYAPQSRYNNHLHHATIIESELTAFPFWIKQENAAQTIKWVE